MPNSSATIIKNNFLIETSGKIDFVGIRLFNSLFHHAYNEIQDKDIHKITFAEIKKYLGYTNQINFKHIRKSLYSLLNFKIEWDIFDEETGEETMGGSTLLASYEFKKGICEFAFAPHMRRRLLADTLYTKINLRLQNLFSGKYSLRMYELAKEFYREKEGLGETRFIPIDKFRKYLGIQDGKINMFKVFKRDILTPSVEEINRISDVYVEVLLEKQGTKITGIKLKIKKNPNQNKEQPASVDQNLLLRSNTKQESNLSTPILSLGIKQTQLDNWLAKYDLDYIQAKLDLTIAQIKAGKIKNTPSGFLVRAIEEDYGSKVSLEEIVEKEAVEARKLNPETCLVDPFDFDSFEAFEAKVEELKTQYYNPFFIQSEVEAAGRGKWGK